MSATQYVAWSVTAGEQPTAAKWGILGTNDAAFNTGVGFNDGIITWRHLATDVIPTGTIHPFAGASQPSSSWLICDGSAVGRGDYPALWSLIGTTYGNGDGTKTFNLPDLRGRTIFGVDPSQGEFSAPGTKGGQKTVQAHNHGVNDPGHNHGVYDPGHQHSSQRNFFADAGGAGNLNMSGGGDGYAQGQVNVQTNTSGTGIGIYGNGTGISIQSTGSGANNLNPYIVLNYIIKT